jgi:hypothetical protein
MTALCRSSWPLGWLRQVLVRRLVLVAAVAATSVVRPWTWAAQLL